MMTTLFLLSSVIFTACQGDECTYEGYPGTCTGTGESEFTFEGEVGGEQLTLTGNELDPDVTLGEGETVDCDFEFIDEGTCTPCLFDIGSCGDEAWDVPRP